MNRMRIVIVYRECPTPFAPPQILRALTLAVCRSGMKSFNFLMTRLERFKARL